MSIPTEKSIQDAIRIVNIAAYSTKDVTLKEELNKTLVTLDECKNTKKFIMNMLDSMYLTDITGDPNGTELITQNNKTLIDIRQKLLK